MSVLDAAADLIDDVLQVHAHGEFEHAPPLHVAADGEELGPRAVFRAELSEPVRAVVQNEADVGQSLHVVQHSGLSEESPDAGEGGTEPRLAPFSLNGFEEGCLLAAYICTRPGAELDLEVITAAHHVFSEVSEALRVLKSSLHDREDIGVFRPEIHIAGMSTDSFSADRHALKHRAGI